MVSTAVAKLILCQVCASIVLNWASHTEVARSGTRVKEDDMEFVVIIYHGSSPLPGSPAWKSLPSSEQKAIYADYAELNTDPRVTLRLPPMSPDKAATVQVRDGNVQVKHGMHLTEGVGGALVIEAENMEAAAAFAARFPQARLGGAVEVRPVEKYF
jgi:hypothetical protein